MIHVIIELAFLPTAVNQRNSFLTLFLLVCMLSR
jgi:hypothetical protein